MNYGTVQFELFPSLARRGMRSILIRSHVLAPLRGCTLSPAPCVGLYFLLYSPPEVRMSKAKPYVRLTQPLVRDSGRKSALRPATWDEALDGTVRGLKAAIEKSGGQSFGLFSCSK